MWPFKKKPKIKVGQVWQYYRFAKDPFMDATITISAIKEGYVKFRYSSGGSGSMAIVALRTLYEFIKEAPNGNDCQRELEKR